MEQLIFNYRNRQSYSIKINLPSNELEKFENEYRKTVIALYKESLISPTVEVVVSNDGSTILDVHLIAKGRLEQFN
ncbi:MAG TPA: hypothetical protein VHE59_19405 [Mucilaginibacter sp.]|nr:hypothetical protein [Mucilaginibacter sp.]